MFLCLPQDLVDGEVMPLLQYEKKQSIARQGNDYYLISNVCPHQNSKILDCKSNIIKCPYHGYQFDLNGQGQGNKFQLVKQRPLFVKSNMIFDLTFNTTWPIDLSYMTLIESRVDTIKCHPETFLDVFLDIDHIPFIHTSVYDRIEITDTSNIKLDFFHYGSMQSVYANSNNHMIEDDRRYGLGACWQTVYPNTTIEWQPGALFVNVAIEKNGYTDVAVFKYKDSRYDENSWVLNEQVWETAWAQDKQLCERIVETPEKNLCELKKHFRNCLVNDYR